MYYNDIMFINSNEYKNYYIIMVIEYLYRHFEKFLKLIRMVLYFINNMNIERYTENNLFILIRLRMST